MESSPWSWDCLLRKCEERINTGKDMGNQKGWERRKKLDFFRPRFRIATFFIHLKMANEIAGAGKRQMLVFHEVKNQFWNVWPRKKFSLNTMMQTVLATSFLLFCKDVFGWEWDLKIRSMEREVKSRNANEERRVDEKDVVVKRRFLERALTDKLPCIY